MKEASGELNLTVITLIALGAVLTFFWWMWDNVIKDSVSDQWGDINDARDNQENEAMTDEGFIIINDYIINFNK